jgi:hypothetical protein
LICVTDSVDEESISRYSHPYLFVWLVRMSGEFGSHFIIV